MRSCVTCDAHLVHKVEKYIMKWAMGMQADQHALYVGGPQHAGTRADGGGSGGGGGGMPIGEEMRSGRYKIEQQHQPQQHQHQQRRPQQ